MTNPINSGNNFSTFDKYSHYTDSGEKPKEEEIPAPYNHYLINQRTSPSAEAHVNSEPVNQTPFNKYDRYESTQEKKLSDDEIPAPYNHYLINNRTESPAQVNSEPLQEKPFNKYEAFLETSKPKTEEEPPNLYNYYGLNRS